jgi:hypothetical protein
MSSTWLLGLTSRLPNEKQIRDDRSHVPIERSHRQFTQTWQRKFSKSCKHRQPGNQKRSPWHSARARRQPRYDWCARGSREAVKALGQLKCRPSSSRRRARNASDEPGENIARKSAPRSIWAGDRGNEERVYKPAEIAKKDLECAYVNGIIRLEAWRGEGYDRVSGSDTMR